MFVTNDAELYENVLTLSNHGRARSQSKQFWPDKIGFKYKISNVQAAIGCAQVERIEELIARKREIMEIYRNRLCQISGIILNPEPLLGMVNGYWMPTVVFDHELGIRQDKLINKFQSCNIDARVFFHPLSSLPMFIPCPNNILAYAIPQRAINLPSYHDICREDIERVIKVINMLLDVVDIKTSSKASFKNEES
jgi:perosamine synthetase